MYRNMYWMDFNGHRNIDFDVQVVQRPNIPQAKKRVTYVEIAGRDGTLTQTDDTYEDIDIKVPLNFLSNINEHFMDKTRALKNWLTGSGELKFSDDIDVFYKVKNVYIDEDIERVLRRAGFFTALFTCDPYTYYESGRVPSTIEECRINPYRFSKPVYHIVGEGNCRLTVNGTHFDANIGQNLIIDTDMSLIYRENGQIQNTIARCYYPDFYLKPGENDISITEGFELRIKPNWRSL